MADRETDREPTMAGLLEQWRTAERATAAAERLAAAAERAAAAAERAAAAAERTAEAALSTVRVALESSEAARQSAADARGASGDAVTEATSMRSDVGLARSESVAAAERYQEGARRLKANEGGSPAG
jgi:hypothetical protein